MDVRAEENHLEKNTAPEPRECRGAEVGVVYLDHLPPLQLYRGLTRTGGLNFGCGGVNGRGGGGGFDARALFVSCGGCHGGV